jgi:hypothetical protein
MQMRWAAYGSVLGAVAALLTACETTPSDPPPHPHQAIGPTQVDPAARTPAGAPPPTTELAQPGGASDITVPDMFKSDDASSAEKLMGFAGATGGPPVTVFLERSGGTFIAGADDATNHVSSVLSYYGRSSTTLPAAGYTGAAWQELVDCVKAQYRDVNVVITDQKPAGGAYTELVVSNTWASTALGITNGVGGIAPLGACRVVPQAVGFVFEAIYDTPGYGGVRGACEAAAHEIGHTLSLSHERLATDLMSYAPADPGKAFQDTASACGVSSQAPEACSCGAATQSSHQQLLTIVGHASASSDGGGATGGGGGGTTGTTDTVAPTVSVVAPLTGAKLPGNAVIDVVVDASDDTALSEVKLVWQYTGAVLGCDASIQGVTCTQVGSRFTWSILVGSGTRGFYAYARDAAGNTTSTQVVTVEAVSATPAPVEAPPTVATELPGDGDVVSPGADVIFQAEVAGDRPIADVRAVWGYSGGTLEYPMVVTTSPGVYQARTTVSTTAAAGWRTVTIQASDDKGHRTIAATRNVYVQ